MDFTENLTIELPSAEAQTHLFSEQEYRDEHGLIVEVSAIHAGLTGNYNNYSAEELEKSVSTWVTPYPKPIIINHDQYSDPLGRIMASKMASEVDGSPYISIQAAISSPDAMSRIMDKRYLTGSVGGSAEQAICSICGADWASASMESIPCRHRRGKTYKGKLAYFDMRDITWKEYSFVNVPGDQRSGVRGVKASAEEADADEWTHSARLFSLDMSKEEVVEFSNAADGKNILESMKKKEATPVYMNLKGAFLSSLAFAAAENLDESAEDADKESNVTNPEIHEEEEDVLEVTQELTSDLNESSAPVEEEEVEEDETSEDETEETVAEGEEEKPEGQESPQQEMPVSRESDETEEEVLEEETDSTEEDIEEEEEAGTDEEVAEAEEEETSEEAMELDESADVETLESRIEELESSNEAIKEENTRLRAALKHSLAERVVDMKISLGLVESEGRMDAVEDHASRSASSLADSIRDLASMPILSNAKTRESFDDAPQVEESSAPVLQDGEEIVSEDEETVLNAEEGETEEQNVEERLFKMFNGAFLTN